MLSLRLSHLHFVLVALGIWVCTAAAQPETPGSPTPVPAADRVLPLEVTVNGAKSGTWLFVERAGVLYAPRDAYEEWRVQLSTDTKTPGTQPIDFKGQQYWPLSAVPGFNAKVNFANQSVELLFSPQAFAATRLTQEKSKKPVVSPVLPSVFLNYDVNYSASYLTAAPTVQDLGMLNEIGVSTGLGVLTNSSIWRNLANNQVLGNPRQWLRLETTATRDFPDENRSLRLGDTSTRAGMLGRNVYFGGIQFGTNFGLTPGFVSQPLPVLTGLSAAPSTVELYVNDVLRQVSNVPTGPFAIENLPTLSGNGDARIVVRDLLGRETVIEQSFFTNSQLLAKGLDDWGMEAGSVRRNLGTTSASYGPGFVSGTWRHGYNKALTLEGRAEVTSQLHTAELGLVSALPWQLLGRAALMPSYEQSMGSGYQWMLGLANQGLRSSESLQVQGADRNFRQLGQDVTVTPTKLQVAGNWSYSSERLGAFGLGYASISRFDSSRVTTMSGNYSTNIGQRSNLMFTASRAQSGFISNAVAMTLVVPLDNNRVASAYASSHDKQNDFYATAAQNPDQDNHLGWRLLAGQQQNRRREEGGVYYYGRNGNLTGDVSNTPDQTALRLGANGGLVLADSHLFATQRLNDSFALAEVAGYGNVGVGLGSTVLTKTDAQGIALIPRLSAYQSNSVRLNPEDLPVSAELDSIEQDVVPAWRSGVKVTFPVRSGRGALLKIVLDDGDVAPAGAIAQIEGDKQEFYVARRGEAFVTGLQASNRVVLNWKDQQCKFDVTLPLETPDEIPRLGPLLCKGIAR